MSRMNLMSAVNMIPIIPKKNFDMRVFRVASFGLRDCQSIGDIIGHMTQLDTEENINKFRFKTGEIDFIKWSENFFGFQYGSNEWDYMFSQLWADHVETNTREHAVERLQNIIDGYHPRNIEHEVQLVQTQIQV